MMQSILVTSPTKSQANESLSDAATVDGDVSSDELRKEQGANFSNLLDSVLTGKGENGDATSEELSEADGELSETALEGETELESELLLEELDVSAEELEQSLDEPVATEEVELSDHELSLLKKAALDEKQSNVSQEALVKPNAQSPKEVTQPILAQIEAALKVDTQVTDPAKAAQISSENPESSLQLKKGQDKTLNDLNNGKFSLESGSIEEEEGEKISTAGVTSEATDKLNKNLFSHNNEGDRNSLVSTTSGSALSSANTASSNLDKLINQNMQRTTSAELQQPLNLQDKHASAMLGERILMMIGQGKQEVQIRLDPAELGSMQIKLQVQQDQVQVAIQTQVGQSRDIIEQNLPRLREQLAQQGVSLGETSVEQQNQQQQQNNQGQKELQNSSSRLANDGSLPEMDDKMEWIAPKIPLPAQGIDYYA